MIPVSLLQNPAVSPSWASRSSLSIRSHRPAAFRRRSRGTCASVQAPERGASGLDIQGKRPTSPLAWKIASNELRARGVTMVSQQEVPFMTARGIQIVDIRPVAEYNSAHLQGSINVEFYRAITGWDMRKFARRAGFAFFGILNGTEFNPDFYASIQEVVGDKGAIFVCNLGGSLEAVSSSEYGMQSRSLMAAYEAIGCGVQGIKVLKGGFSDWTRNGRPYEANGQLINGPDDEK